MFLKKLKCPGEKLGGQSHRRLSSALTEVGQLQDGENEGNSPPRAHCPAGMFPMLFTHSLVVLGTAPARLLLLLWWLLLGVFYKENICFGQKK